jgi:hypothetical protein
MCRFPTLSLLAEMKFGPDDMLDVVITHVHFNHAGSIGASIEDRVSLIDGDKDHVLPGESRLSRATASICAVRSPAAATANTL